MTRRRHVVVVGIDGLRFDRIAPAGAPELGALVASGYSSTTRLPPGPTLSGPGWATNLTGVGPDEHRVRSNAWGTSSAVTRYPDFLSRVATADPGLSTYAAVTWAPILDGSAGDPLITSAVGTRYVSTGDADTAADLLRQLDGAAAPNVSFVHLDDVDAAGHAHGAASSAYLEAVAAVDGHVGRIRRAVAARPASEAWWIIVTTDHGHTDAGGHGGDTGPERSSFVIKSGPGITRTTPTVPPRNVDIAADVLSTFGIPVPAVLEGRPLVTAPAGRPAS